MSLHPPCLRCSNAVIDSAAPGAGGNFNQNFPTLFFVFFLLHTKQKFVRPLRLKAAVKSSRGIRPDPVMATRLSKNASFVSESHFPFSLPATGSADFPQSIAVLRAPSACPVCSAIRSGECMEDAGHRFPFSHRGGRRKTAHAHVNGHRKRKSSELRCHPCTCPLLLCQVRQG